MAQLLSTRSATQRRDEAQSLALMKFFLDKGVDINELEFENLRVDQSRGLELREEISGPLCMLLQGRAM